MLKEKIKKILGIKDIEASKEKNLQTEENIRVVNILMLGDESEWFINLCRESGGEKECLPNDTEFNSE